jgi:hypothetical protein
LTEGTCILLAALGLSASMTESDARLGFHPTHDQLMYVADLKDGSQILSVARGEPSKVWDLETGELVGEFGRSVGGDFVAAAFHPTESRLYVEVDADLIGIFTLDPDELIQIAGSRLSRDLTEEECQLYLRRSCEGG